MIKWYIISTNQTYLLHMILYHQPSILFFYFSYTTLLCSSKWIVRNSYQSLLNVKFKPLLSPIDIFKKNFERFEKQRFFVGYKSPPIFNKINYFISEKKKKKKPLKIIKGSFPILNFPRASFQNLKQNRKIKTLIGTPLRDI